MKLFNPDNYDGSDRHKQIYSRSETAYTIVDFSAAVLFVIGSILFFKASTTTLATWMFLFGSILFGCRPTIKLWREMAYVRTGRDAESSARTGPSHNESEQGPSSSGRRSRRAP